MKRVLIVEDNAINRELMDYLLRAHRYETLNAVDGRVGLELARRERPDLAERGHERDDRLGRRLVHARRLTSAEPLAAAGTTSSDDPGRPTRVVACPGDVRCP
jgi:CheY-like chemotaxis protein